MVNWTRILEKTFNNSIPEYAIWTDIESIINILNYISSEKNSNHLFYPEGGGMDLISASKSNETSCIELNTGLNEVFKPKKLTFHKIFDTDQSYFRIELEELQLITSGNNTEFSENLYEIESNQYISYSEFFTYDLDYTKNTFEPRPVVRLLKGSIVIFSKSSIYNSISDTYHGIHNKYTEEEFYNQVINMVRKFNE